MKPVFLIGAGFNVEARSEVGPFIGHSIYIGKHEIEVAYPLVRDLWQICFGVSPSGELSFEDKLAESIEQSNFEPVDRMIASLQKADYYVARAHATSSERTTYQAFLQRFVGSTFLTFNYDSLIEIILYHAGHWYPHDGYGVPVVVDVEDDGAPSLNEVASVSKVLHLHGTLCVFASTTFDRRSPGAEFDEIVSRVIPEYRFDPGSTANCFYPFHRVRPELADDDENRSRIVAPVPDKAPYLERHFVEETYRRARLELRGTEKVISIGYAFNPLDRVSYAGILAEVEQGGGELTIVAPDAAVIADRLRVEFRNLRIVAVGRGFCSWFAGMER